MKAIDRTNWPAGPWDDELDEYSWTTDTGFPALVQRLHTGALVGWVTAPTVPNVGVEWQQYMNDLNSVLKQHSLSCGVVIRTQEENVSKFGISFEWFDCPTSIANDVASRGAYVTVAEAKDKCEALAFFLSMPLPSLSSSAEEDDV